MDKGWYPKLDFHATLCRSSIRVFFSNFWNTKPHAALGHRYIQNPKNYDIRVLTRSFTSCSNSETRSNRQFPRFHKTAMRWRSSSSHPTMMSFSWLKSPVLNAVLHRIASVRAYVGRTAVHVIKSNVVCLMCSDRTCPSLLWKFLHHLLPDVSTVKLYCFIFIVFFFHHFLLISQKWCQQLIQDLILDLLQNYMPRLWKIHLCLEHINTER